MDFHEIELLSYGIIVVPWDYFRPVSRFVSNLISNHYENRSNDIVNNWVEEQRHSSMSLKELATKRHREMAPFEHTEHTFKGAVTWARRPDVRVEFCKSVAARANDIAINMCRDPHWRQIFNDVEDSHVRQTLE